MLDPPAPAVPFTDLTPHDIYLSLGASSLPQLDDLVAQAPALTDPIILARIQQTILSQLSQSHPNDVHPVGLDLPQDVAQAVLERIRAAGGDGTLAPSAYRTPLVPLHQALAIAHGFLAPWLAKEIPQAQFRGVVSYWRHSATSWRVEAVLAYPDHRQYFVDERMIAYIDKLDGHVQTLDDRRQGSTPSQAALPTAQHAAESVSSATSATWAARPDMDANPISYVSMAVATIQMGAYAEALQLCDRAIQLGVDTWEPYWARARCLDQLGRHVEALDAIRQAHARAADQAIVTSDLCAILIGLSKHAEALDGADQFLASHPPDFAVVANRARALFYLGRYAEALDACEQALSIAPAEADCSMVWSFKGMALARMSRYDEANAALDTAIALAEQPAGQEFNADKARQLQQADNWRNKALCLAGLKRYDDAISAFDRCLALSPNDVQALTLKARTLITQQRYADAYDPTSRALLLKPDDVDLLVMRAALASTLGHQDDLQEMLHRLKAIDPQKAAQIEGQLVPPAQQ